MTKIWFASLLLSSVLLLLSATPVFAGGWAVVTVDELPQHLRAGEITVIGFTIRQHGQHPVNLENVVLTATQATSGETVTFAVRQAGAEGHYVVDLLLPSAGEWQWTIQPDRFPAVQLAPILVVGKAAARTNPVGDSLPWFLTGIGALVFGGAALIPRGLWRVLTRRRRIAAGALGLLCVIGGLGGAGYLGLRLPYVVAAQPTTTTVDHGRALFIAKGCTTCHLHAEARNTWSTESGPNLTNYQNTAEYLQVWLKDPQAIKPNTEMPNLALQAHEIEALTAFLTHPTP